MIKTIQLKNFKGFKDTGKIDLKPLTVLCGTNSSGKSTIIQSILMLKQTFESQSPYRTILLNGEFVHLGSFDDLIYNKIPENKVQIIFDIDTSRIAEKTQFSRKIPINILLNNFDFKNPLIDRNNFENILEINFGLRLQDPPISKEPYIENYKIKAKSVSPSNQSFNGTEIEFERINDEYLVKWKKTQIYPFEICRLKIPKEIKHYYCPKCKINHRTNSNVGKDHYYYNYVNENQYHTKASFINLVPEIRMEDELKIGEYPTKPYFHIARPLFSLRHIFQNVFENLFYIGPLREEPSRRYIYESEIIDIGNHGENAPFILSIEGNNEIEPYFLFQPNEGEWKQITNDTLQEGVNRWLNYMDISFECEIKSEKEIIRLYLPLAQDKEVKVTLADVGFGVSQILPILVEGLRIRNGQTLILEQPEIHLHPKLQMQLADFFISMILSGKNILLETHSDHIINRISRRIIESEDNNIISKTNILFFEQGHEGSIPYQVEIDRDLGIVNWPKGFFDQSVEETEAIIFSGIEKRRKNKKE